MEAIAPERRLAGRYVLEDRIGIGELATVWRARDEVLARTVALKILRADLARDPALLQRFHRNAVAAAHLTHPAIVRVFDAGIDRGACFVVMELVEGPTLSQGLASPGRTEPSRAASILVEVLAAMQAAHAAGVLHRGLGPDEVFVIDRPGAEPRVKVSDFGLTATAVIGWPGPPGGTRCLSPEQALGGEATPSSDIYAAGAVLYELLTGRPPFAPNDQVPRRAKRDPVPPRDLVAGLPRGLEAAALRALAGRPEDRYPSAASMSTAIQPFASTASGPPAAVRTEPQGAEPARRGAAAASAFRSWMLVPLVILVLAAAVMAGGLALGKLRLGGPLGIRPAGPGPTAAKVLAPLRALPIASAKDFDPVSGGGDGTENPQDLPLILDGDPATAWQAERYFSAALGGRKSGVGVWLQLAAAAEVHRVVIQSGLPGWTFELRSGSSPADTTALRSISGETSFAAAAAASGRTVIELRPATASGILIWITGLAPDAGRYTAEISGVSVVGRTG